MEAETCFGGLSADVNGIDVASCTPKTPTRWRFHVMSAPPQGRTQGAGQFCIRPPRALILSFGLPSPEFGRGDGGEGWSAARNEPRRFSSLGPEGQRPAGQFRQYGKA